MKQLMKLQKINRELLKKSAKLFLKAINPDLLNQDVIAETPDRVARSWLEMLSGYNVDDKEIYKTFSCENNNLVIIKDIKFVSVCEHHLLPFSGVVNIGYIPNGKVLGLSKFSRIVDCFAKRLQLQERLTEDIAESIIKNLDIVDLFIITKAKHDCMSCRGVKQKTSITNTFFKSGKFKKYKESELLKLLGNDF